MLILSFDTSSKNIAVAIGRDDQVINTYSSGTLLTHSQTLMPTVDRLLQESGINIKEINYLAVSQGPGSFTGLRIGCATAKGLAKGLNIPIVGLSSLEVLAYNYIAEEVLICPIMDARRQQIYTGLYRAKGGSVETIFKDRVINIDEWLNHLKTFSFEDIYLTGDGHLYHDKFKEIFGDKLMNTPERLISPQGEVLLALARESIINNKNLFTYLDFIPIYLREASAKKE